MKLAQNDKNKKDMVDLGALEILVEMGRTGTDLDIHGIYHLDIYGNSVKQLDQICMSRIYAGCPKEPLVKKCDCQIM